MAWSLIPGIGVEVFTIEGSLVNTRSGRLLSLVGWPCTCERPCSIVTSKSTRCTSQSPAPLLTDISQLIAGQLESRARMMYGLLPV